VFFLNSGTLELRSAQSTKAKVKVLSIKNCQQNTFSSTALCLLVTALNANKALSSHKLNTVQAIKAKPVYTKIEDYNY